MRWSLLVVLSIVSQVGCATLFAHKVQDVGLTSDPDHAQVFVDGQLRGETPITVSLEAKKSHSLLFKKEGYPDQFHELRTSVGAGWVILDILGGLIPLVVDIATGDWNALTEDRVHVVMGHEKKPLPPDACRLEGTPVWEQASEEDRARMRQACSERGPTRCNLEERPEWKSASAAEKKRMLEECRQKGPRAPVPSS